MLPSPRFIVMVFLAAPLFLAGVFGDFFTAVGIVYLSFLAIYAILDLLLLPGHRSITVRRSVPERLSLSEPTFISYEIRNDTRRSVQIVIAEDLPENIDAQPSICKILIGPRMEAVATCKLTAHKRGQYQLSGLDIRVLPQMGLFYRQFRLVLPAEVKVFPNLLDLKRYDLLLRRGLAREVGLTRLRQIGQGSEFESLRLRDEGDDLSRVDWKATAHRGQIIVKNYQPERQQSVVVAIDLGRATAAEFDGLSRLDYFINATLMLAYSALRQGDWFSLIAFSDRIESYLPPLRGLANIDRVARGLFQLQPCLREADYAKACRYLLLKNRKRSLICCMTDVLDKEANAVIIGYLARFARYHLPLIVTLADPAIHRMAEEPLAYCSDPYQKAVAIDVLTTREEALLTMRRQGVSVLDVEPKALTPNLINRYIQIKSTHLL